MFIKVAKSVHASQFYYFSAFSAKVKFAQMVRKMWPPLNFTFLCVFWGVAIIGEGFCAFCDLVRTFFGRVTCFWEHDFGELAWLRSNLTKIMTFMPFERLSDRVSGGSIYLGTTFGVCAYNK